MIGQVGIAVLRGAGDMVTGLVAMTCENIVNICVAFALVRGLGPAPRLGWDGLAYAAMAGYITTAVIVAVRLLIGRYGLRIDWRLMRPDFSLIRRLLRIGVPGGADVLAIVACQFWFLSIVNRLGNVSAAAHGVAITIESLAYLPGSAFGVAATTLVGQCLGARDDRRAAQSVRLAALACLGLMTAIAVLLFLSQPNGWKLVGVRRAGRNRQIGELSATLVRIVAFGQRERWALLMVMNGGPARARATRGSRWPRRSSASSACGCRWPTGWPGMRCRCISLAWTCTSTVAIWASAASVRDGRRHDGPPSALVLWRFSRGQWKRIEV